MPDKNWQFELEEYIKQGVKVDAPVSSELLTTIFS